MNDCSNCYIFVSDENNQCCAVADEALTAQNQELPMKLSMWMIANRLSPVMEIKSRISPDAKPILNSARLAYSTNCVHVYKEKDCIVYDGEGDQIRLFNTGLTEAFEILQGIFDDFQDWEAQVRETLDESDFDRIVSLCWIFFQNPMVIEDANHRFVAMTQNIPEEEMDPEWGYMKKFGYASLQTVRSIRNEYGINYEVMSGSHYFSFKKNTNMRYGGGSYMLRFGNVNYGRILVIARYRALNAGDLQLMEILGRMIEPVMGSAEPSVTNQYNIFYNLLMNRPYSPEELSRQLMYRSWKEDDLYQVTLIFPQHDPDTGMDLPVSLKMLPDLLSRQLPDALVLTGDPYLIIVSNRNLTADAGTGKMFHTLTEFNPVRIGISLRKQGLSNLHFLMRQAEYAIEYAALMDKPESDTEHSIFCFENAACAFLLGEESALQKRKACHPVITNMYESPQGHMRELYKTLQVFLDCSCSYVKTAEALYTHKNTVFYRIKRCEELLETDFQDPGICHYIRLSMMYLELYDIIRQNDQ